MNYDLLIFMMIYDQIFIKSGQQVIKNKIDIKTRCENSSWDYSSTAHTIFIKNNHVIKSIRSINLKKRTDVGQKRTSGIVQTSKCLFLRQYFFQVFDSHQSKVREI